MANDGMSGLGTTLTGSSTGLLGAIRKISFPGMSAGEIDLSTLDSVDGWKEFIASMKDTGSLSFEVVYSAARAEALFAAFAGANETWTIALPDGSTFACDGFIKELGGEIPMENDSVVQTVGLRMSGPPTFTPA